MLEIKLTDSTEHKNVPIMPERFNTTTKPSDYPIIDTSLISTTKLKDYK